LFSPFKIVEIINLNGDKVPRRISSRGAWLLCFRYCLKYFLREWVSILCITIKLIK
jgi:hypothetical protein